MKLYEVCKYAKEKYTTTTTKDIHLKKRKRKKNRFGIVSIFQQGYELDNKK